MARSNGKQMRMGTQSLIQVIQAFARHADDNSNDDEEDAQEEMPQDHKVMGEGGSSCCKCADLVKQTCTPR